MNALTAAIITMSCIPSFTYCMLSDLQERTLVPLQQSIASLSESLSGSLPESLSSFQQSITPRIYFSENDRLNAQDSNGLLSCQEVLYQKTKNLLSDTHKEEKSAITKQLCEIITLHNGIKEAYEIKENIMSPFALKHEQSLCEKAQSIVGLSNNEKARIALFYAHLETYQNGLKGNQTISPTIQQPNTQENINANIDLEQIPAQNIDYEKFETLISYLLQNKQ
jgi:hypothetical protein